MQSVAASLVSQLKDMEKKFKALEDKCVDDDPQKFTDVRSYQRFDKLKNDCVELFNEAERYLAQRHPWYVRYKTPSKERDKGPSSYAIHCTTLLLDVDSQWDDPALPLIPNHPEGHREMPADSRVISVLNPFVVSMNSSKVSDPTVGNLYEDEHGVVWRYQGVSTLLGVKEFHFATLDTHYQEHIWISPERWQQSPLKSCTETQLSPRDRPRRRSLQRGSTP